MLTWSNYWTLAYLKYEQVEFVYFISSCKFATCCVPFAFVRKVLKQLLIYLLTEMIEYWIFAIWSQIWSGITIEVFPSRRSPHDNQLADVRHGQRECHSYEHRTAETFECQGGLSHGKEHRADHCNSVLLCKITYHFIQLICTFCAFLFVKLWKGLALASSLLCPSSIIVILFLVVVVVV